MLDRDKEEIQGTRTFISAFDGLAKSHLFPFEKPVKPTTRLLWHPAVKASPVPVLQFSRGREGFGNALKTSNYAPQVSTRESTHPQILQALEQAWTIIVLHSSKAQSYRNAMLAADRLLGQRGFPSSKGS